MHYQLVTSVDIWYSFTARPPEGLYRTCLRIILPRGREGSTDSQAPTPPLVKCCSMGGYLPALACWHMGTVGFHRYLMHSSEKWGQKVRIWISAEARYCWTIHVWSWLSQQRLGIKAGQEDVRRQELPFSSLCSPLPSFLILILRMRKIIYWLFSTGLQCLRFPPLDSQWLLQVEWLAFRRNVWVCGRRSRHIKSRGFQTWWTDWDQTVMMFSLILGKEKNKGNGVCYSWSGKWVIKTHMDCESTPLTTMG